MRRGCRYAAVRIAFQRHPGLVADDEIAVEDDVGGAQEVDSLARAAEVADVGDQVAGDPPGGLLELQARDVARTDLAAGEIDLGPVGIDALVGELDDHPVQGDLAAGFRQDDAPPVSARHIDRVGGEVDRIAIRTRGRERSPHHEFEVEGLSPF